MPVGHRIHGHGPIKVLAFHGWFGSNDDWWPLQSGLDPDRYTLAFMDQRGYGLSKELPGNHSVEEVARDGVEIADHLGWARFHLMGHSMGGKVVQQVLRTERQRVQSCVVLTPVPASGAGMDAATLALFGSAGSNADVRYGIISHSVGDRLPPFWVKAIAAASFKNSTQAAFDASFRSWALEDFAQDVQGALTPMLVVAGEHDPVLNVAVMTATFLDWYPNAQLEVMANAGHYPQLETPLCLASRIERFLLAQA